MSKSKRRNGCLLFFLILLIAVAIIWFFARNGLARSGLEQVLAHNTNCETDIGAISLAPLANRIEVRDLKLDSPDVKGERPMLVLQRLVADVSPSSLVQAPIKVRNLDIEIAELHILRLPDGRSNLAALGERAVALLPPPPKKPAGSATGSGTATPPSPPPEETASDNSSFGDSVDLSQLRLAVGIVSLDDQARQMKFTARPSGAGQAFVFDHSYEGMKSLDELREAITRDLRATLGL